MSTSTTNAGPCDCCGVTSATRNDDKQCLDCEHNMLQHDLYVGEVLERVLGAAVDSALMDLAPGDVFEIVARSVKRTGCDGAMPLAVVKERDSNNVAARQAA
jgi:hypothetical protein